MGKIKKAKANVFKIAVEKTSDIANCYQTGLQGLGKYSQKIELSETNQCLGSVDIDLCTKAKYPESNRWDYALCYKKEVFFVEVHGAKTAADGQAAARAVANGALVKTSWFGCDPNWGRILGALGASSCSLVEEKIDLAYALPGSRKLTYALRRGQPTSVTFAQLCKLVANPEFELHVFLNFFE